MRRDVLRVGVGRACLELALGVSLVVAGRGASRTATAALAIASMLIAFAGGGAWRSARKAFAAAHVALLGVALFALASHVAPPLASPALGLAFGVAIETLHADLNARRRISESARSLRWPNSALLRRVGSVLLISTGARAMLWLEARVTLASPASIISLLATLGALATLSAGFGAGPGRPVARPLDALAFLSLGLVVALCRPA